MVGRAGYLATWIIFAALIAFPLITSNNYYLQMATTMATLSILALGYNMLFGLTGQISVGHAAFYAVGAYVSVLLEIKLGVPFVLSIIIGMAAAGLLALAVGYPLLRLRGHYLALGTLGFGMIVFVVLMQWQDVTGGPSGLPVPRSAIFGHVLDWRDFYYIAMSLAVLTFIGCQHIIHSYIGRAFASVREDEEAAQTLGIRVVYYKIISFVFSAVLAGLAGGIYPRANSYITPELFDVNMSIKLLIVVVIGGVGSNWGVVLGVLLLTILPQVLTLFQEYELLLFGLITFLVVVLLPKGLVSVLVQLAFLFGPGKVRQLAKDDELS